MEAFSRQFRHDPRVPNFPKDSSNPASFDVLESAPQWSLANRRVSLGGLIDWVNDRGIETADATIPNLKMLHIDMDANRQQPLVSESLLDAIFCGFRIGSCAKNLAVWREREVGFYQYPGRGTNGIWTFSLLVYEAAMTWSYSATSYSTRAVFYGPRGYWANLRKDFLLYSDLSGHPLFPGFVWAAGCVAQTLRSLPVQNRLMRQIERATGYTPRGSDYIVSMGDKPRISLGDVSKDVANASNRNAAKWARINTLKPILELLLTDPSHPLCTQTAVWQEAEGVAQCLLNLIKAKEQVKVLMETRVQNQMTIVSKAAGNETEQPRA